MDNSFSMTSESINGITSVLDTGRICLLDADFLKYHVTAKRAKQIEDEKKSGILEIYHKEDPVIVILKNNLNDFFLSRIKDPIIFCFSGASKNIYRYHCAVEKEYKGGRKKDETYEGQLSDMFKVMKYIQDNFMTLLFEDLEADDIVTALQDNDYTYIASKDKDLKQVPGFHYDFLKNNISEIKSDKAMYNLMYQMISGDNVDCIPGIPGYGPKKAIQILSEENLKPSQYSRRVFYEYQKKFGQFEGIDRFVESWNLIKMRMNRGSYFQSKYRKMFDLKEHLVNQLKQQKG